MKITINQFAAVQMKPQCDLAFDQKAQQIIFDQGQQIGLYTLPDNSTSFAPGIIRVVQEESKKEDRKIIEGQKQLKRIAKPSPNIFNQLRWDCSNSSAKVIISPTGLAISTLSSEDEIAVSTLALKFPKELYWEFICPLNCQNIGLGVIREGYHLGQGSAAFKKNSTFIEMFEFRTTTPRVIGIKVDLIAGELKCWLNGNFQPQRTKKLANHSPNTTWYPFAKLKEKGQQLILNPFAIDPENPNNSQWSSKQQDKSKSIDVINNLMDRLDTMIQCANDEWVFLSDSTENLFQQLKPEELKTKLFLTNKLSKFRIFGLQFSSPEDKEAAIKFLTKKKEEITTMNIFTIDQASNCLEGIIAFNKTHQKSGIKDPLHNQLYEFIEINIDKFKACLPINESLPINQLKPQLQEIIKNFKQSMQSESQQQQSQQIQQQQEQQENYPVSFHYLPKTDNLIIANGPILKLIRRNPFNNKFEFNPYVLSNKPKDLSSIVTIQIPKQLQELLASSINWEYFFENNQDQSQLENYIEFFQQLQSSNGINIKMSIQKVSSLVQSLLLYCSSMINLFKEKYSKLNLTQKLKNKTDNEVPEFLKDIAIFMSEEEEKINENPEQSAFQGEKIAFICPGLHTYYELLEQLLIVDETLYAMCLHNDATPQLRQSLQSSSLRLHTSFARLSSLLNFPCSENYSKIELAELGIFNKGDLMLDPRHTLQPQIILADRLPNITAMQPLSMMLKQMLPSNRMLLAQPCANVPLHITINNLPHQTHNSLNKNYKSIKVLSDDNSNFCATIDSEGSVTLWNTELALFPVYYSNFKQETKKIDKDNESEVNSPEVMDLFLGGLNIYDEAYPVDDLDKKVQATEKKEEPVQVDIVPDQTMVETLYSMGFPLELAKKALIQTKNAGVSNAIDAVIVLQDESSKIASKSNQTILKPQWTCLECTFININGTKNCEICGSQAPISAYYTQEEIQREETIEMQKAQQLKEEKQQSEQASPVKEPVKELSPVIQQQQLPQKDNVKDFLKEAETTNSFFLQSKLSFLSPLVVGACFTNKQSSWGKSLVRLRRFGYTKELLSNYFSAITKSHFLQFIQGKLKEKQFFYSNLMPYLVKYTDYKSIEEELFKSDHRLTAEVLEPLFISRQNSQLTSEFNFPIGFECHDEANIEIDMEEILACHIRKIEKSQVDNIDSKEQKTNKKENQESISQQTEEMFELQVVGLKNSKTVISSYQIKMFNNFPYLNDPLLKAIEIKEPTELPFINYDQTMNLNLYIIQLDDEICIVYKNELYQISMNKNSFGQSISLEKLSFDVQKLKQISDQQYSIQGNDQAILTVLSSKGKIYSQPQNISQISTEVNLKGQLPKLASLTSGQLKSLRDLIKVQDVGAIGIPAPNYSSLYNPLSQSYTKNTWLLRNNLSSVQLNLVKKTPVISLNLEIILERSPIGKPANQIEEQKQPELENSPKIEENKKVGLSNFSLLEGSGESSSSNKYLPLQVIRNEGAQYNINVSQSRLAFPNNEIFVTNYGGSSFTFTHLHDKLMMIDSITIHSTFISAQGGYPIGSGLIFTANQSSYFNLTDEFHKMLPDVQFFQFNQLIQQYAQWKEQRKLDKRPLNFWEPVGCFNFDSKSEQLTIELDFKRPCKYIFLKPTQMRKEPKNFFINFQTEPLEIKFFGVKGTILDDDDANLLTEDSQQDPYFTELSEFLLQNSKVITVEGNIGTKTKPKWEKLDKINKAIVKEEIITALANQQINIKQWEQISEKLPLTLKLGIVLQDTKLQLNSYTAFRVNFNFNQDPSPKHWTFKSLSIQLKIATDSGNLKELEQTNPSVLRNCLLDPQQYESFNQGLVGLLCDEQQSLQSKKIIQKLLTELVRQRTEFAQKIYKDLSLDKYLELNLLQETNSKFPEVFSFLKLFSNEANFAELMLKSLLTILQKLVKRQIQCTNFGLKGFFTLLNWCSLVNPSSTFQEVLGALHQLALKIKELRSPDYNILRTQYDITSLAFEKEIFCEDNLCFVGSNMLEKFEKKDEKKEIMISQPLSATEIKRPLKIRFLTEQLPNSRNYLIDLLQPTRLTDILLAVEKNSNICKMRICIQVAKEDPQALNGFKFYTIHQQMFTESTWIQLSNYAYDANAKKFFSNEKLECIGFTNFTPNENSVVNIKEIRYLRIQISHSYQLTSKMTAEQIPLGNIIPEIFGEQVESKSKGLIQELNKDFEAITQENTVFHSTVQFDQLPQIEKFEIKENSELYFYDNTGYLKKQKVESLGENLSEQEKLQNQEISNIMQQLENLQSDLSQRIYQYRANLSSSSAQKDEIKYLCQHIEELKLQLLKLNETQGKLIVKDNCLDFLYSFALKCSQFLRRIETTESKQQQQQQSLTEAVPQITIRDMSLDFFEIFCIHECGPSNPMSLGNELLTFLIDCLINNLMEREWQYFVIKIIQKFLCNAISIASSPVDQIYSHTRVIQALDQISIPNGEVLAYLSFKLGIKINPVTNQLEFTKSSLSSPTKLQQQEKKRDTEQSLLCNLASILILLNKGYKKMPSEILDPKKIQHKGCYCHNCGQNKFIQGLRLKCLNCPNLDCCSQQLCQQKHLMNYPNHCFILIEDELPLVPDNIQTLGETPNPLSSPFTFEEPKTDIHLIKCDECEKEITGIRMMCCNCEDYSLCADCYSKQKHTKYHIFAKLEYKIQVPINSTPKQLFQMLDPRLYPLKIPTTEKPTITRQLSRMMKREPQQVIMEEEGQIDEESKETEQMAWMPTSSAPLGLKRSLSHPVKEQTKPRLTAANIISKLHESERENEELFLQMPRLDHEESLRLAFYVAIWISENSLNFSDIDKINMLSLVLDLIQEIMKRSSMVGICEILKQQVLFMKLFFNIVKLGSSDLLAKFRAFLEAFASPVNEPKFDEYYLKQLTPNEKAKATLEKNAVQETKLLLIYHIQTILNWELDYALAPNYSTFYSQILKDQITPVSWLENIAFILDFLQNATEKIEKDLKDFYKGKKHIQKQQRKQQQQQQQQPLIEENKTQQIQEYKKDEDKGEGLQPPGVFRSVSSSISQRIQQQSMMQGGATSTELEKVSQPEKSTSITLQTALRLISLLGPSSARPNSQFTFQNSANLWSLVLKMILKVKVSALIEENVFDHLINAFLISSLEIQEIMFPEILKLTQNMVNQANYQKELCGVVLSAIFSLINKNELFSQTEKQSPTKQQQLVIPSDIPQQLDLTTFDPIIFNLLQGWLDILLTKTTPKPDDFYSKPLTKAFCKLNSEGVASLLYNVSIFLKYHLNIGGNEGAELADQNLILQLNLADDMLKLLIYSESSSNLLALSELFGKPEKFTNQIKSSLRNFIEWYFLNKSDAKGQSPSTACLTSISDSVLRLFQIANDSEIIIKQCLEELIHSCQALDLLIIKLSRSSQLTAYLSMLYNNRVCKILQELFEMWTTSDTLAQHVAFEVKGFEYLLDRMGLSEQEFPQIQLQEEKQALVVQETLKNSLLEGTDLIEYIQDTQIAPKDKQEGQNKNQANDQKSGAQSTAQFSIEELKEEEFANKLIILNQPGQHFSGITPDWSVNKKGVRNRITFFQMTNQYYMEYIMVFQLDRLCQMKQFKIGFNSVWTDYSDKVLGLPTSVLLEGGVNDKQFFPMGTLEPFNDEGYANYSVKVYLKNFQKLRFKKPGQSFEEAMKSLQSPPVKFIKLRMRRPIVTFVEQLSLLSNKPYKNIAISISFISITGVNTDKIPVNITTKLLDTQKASALQVLGKLCNPTYSETLNILANKKEVIDKFKSSFDMLSNYLLVQETWLSPVFLAIAQHNQEMGDWIINKFLDLSKSTQHAKMILEIILSNSEYSFSRLQRLYNFIMTSFTEINSSLKGESIHKYSSLISFVDIFSPGVRLSSLDLQSKSDKLIFQCEQQHIENIFKAFDSQHNNQAISKSLIKFLITLLYIPHPFALTSEGLVEYCLDQLWTISSSKTYFLELLSPLLAGSSKAAAWMLVNNAEKLEQILQSLESKLEENSCECSKILQYQFGLVNSVACRDQNIKKYIVSKDWHLRIYQKLKNVKADQHVLILKTKDQELLQLFVDFIKNTTLGFPTAEQKLAKTLIDDLSLLETKRDMNFVINLLVPLLNAEIDVPVCLHPYDSQSKRWLTEGRRLAGVARKQLTTHETTFTSKAFNQSQKETFFQNLKQFTTSTGLYSKIQKSAWELTLNQTEDGQSNLQDQIDKKVLKNGPFIIIIEGTNSGKNCLTGIFSSQSISDMLSEDLSYETAYNIPWSEDSFFFYYEDEFTMHFSTPQYSGQNYFGQFHIFEDGGSGISFFYNGGERIFLSLQSGTTTYVDINLYDMKPVETDQKSFPTEIPADFIFRKAEYWNLKISQQQLVMQQMGKTADNSNIFSTILQPNWYSQNNPLSSYRTSPIYNIPAFISVEKMIENMFPASISVSSHLTKETLKFDTIVKDIWEFAEQEPLANHILDIDFDVQLLFESTSSEQPGHQSSLFTIEKFEQWKKQAKQPIMSYMPTMNIFEAFEQTDGVKKIIEVILKSLTLWKNKELATRWFTWIKELSSFSRLPHFFGLFIKNKDCIELLFQILAGLPDEEEKETEKKPVAKGAKPETKKWDIQEQMAIKYSYQILADVFRVDNDSKIRDYALDNQLIERIFERIGVISKEVKRKWVDNYEEEEEEKQKKEEKKVKTEDKSKEESYKKKVVKKQGIGYASDNTGQNQKWNVNEYIESKKAQSDQLRSLIGILQTFLDFKGWTPPAKLKAIICESSFLPLLESALRSGSLLDMSKESELYITYFKIIQVMSKHIEIIPCFLDLDPHYQPQQTASIITLLSKIKDTATIFLQCCSNQQKKDDSTTTQLELANLILDTYKIAESSIQRLTEADTQEVNIQDVLKLPLAESYKLLLQDLRFGYMNMKDTSDKYKHHYSSYLNQNYNPQATKMIRLAQELADLSTALPIDHTSSIFIRCDDHRVDAMKAVVMGAAGTPYAHGAFEYDIYFDDSYPNSPPKVNLETTGGGKVRFNPNLYSCGKVCLSLLGTWRGNATENWDPKLSTLLQVLMSVLAIIMSEEIYFNEPGFEGEAGTEEGERKDEAYSNIVRYCNIKYAMIGQLKNPSKGFETVIKRHFYLKKAEILEECYKWIKFAENRDASYTGLIHDHNSSWCQEFKKDKKRYAVMLKEAVKELEDEFNKLEAPQVNDLKSSVRKVIKKKKKEEVKIEQGAMDLNEIDVSYGKGNQQSQLKELDIESAEVKDRWSRYIGALGIEAVARQAKAKILLIGCGTLGVEIAKNIVLSGVKKMVIWDESKVEHKDLAGQFFLTEQDIGERRDKAALGKIQELNLYVAVEMIEQFKNESISEYDLVVVTENDKEEMFGKLCREKKVKFVSTAVQGPFAKVFNDLGSEFQVLEKNDIEPVEMMIESINSEKKAKVKLLQGVKHNLQDGDVVMIYGIQGMELIDKSFVYKQEVEIEGAKIEKITSINGTLHKVEIININSFYIGDTTMFTPYVRNGLAKLVKLPIKLNFDSWEKCNAIEFKPSFDENLFYHDSSKLDNQQYCHIAFKLLSLFRDKFKRSPIAWDLKDLKEFLALGESNYEKFEIKEEGKAELIKFCTKFCLSCQGLFAPLCAFIGGVVSQEIIKAITQKYLPIRQYFYSDCIEVLPQLPEKMEELTEQAIETLGMIPDKTKPSRMDGLQQVVSKQVVDNLKQANLFMIGAGAIGCELLKNFAMVGVGAGGKGMITVTDPDHIETSNLSRQFLFREKHITKPKSQTAAAAAIQMNPELKGHIYARLDKVHAATEHIFSDNFFLRQTVIANALDNVAARIYMDQRCVANKKPLLESGTLGPRGHVQVILPYQTESYGSMKDPEEEGEIPHCTLKMFPEETLHCVEFARDKFGKLFTQRPKQLVRILEDKGFKASSNEEMKALNEAIILLSKKPKDFKDCIEYARNKFQKYFVNDIRQLLYTYPLDTKTKEGNLFWSLPKRPPTELNFDCKNELHRQFILAMACLRATIFNLKDVNLQELRKDKQKLEEWMKIAGEVKVADFVPSKEKAKAIATEVDEEKKEQESEEQKEKEQKQPEQDTSNESEVQLKKLEQLILANGKPVVSSEEFEKDLDTNFHIDFMYSLGNLRASNYQLTPMDWITVKLKAGRIIPALATTTAVVAGLQTIELVKTIKGTELKDFKNAFLNLAVNSMQLTEPLSVAKVKVGAKQIEVSLWDRWDLEIPANQKNKISIVKIMAETNQKFGVVVKDVMCGAKLIFAKGLTDAKTSEKPIAQTIEIENEDKYLDLIITCVNNEAELEKEKPEILQGIPPLRIVFVEK